MFGKRRCKGGEDCAGTAHLCMLSKDREWSKVRALVKDARFFCKKCGRAARNSENLCSPAKV